MSICSAITRVCADLGIGEVLVEGIDDDNVSIVASLLEHALCGVDSRKDGGNLATSVDDFVTDTNCIDVVPCIGCIDILNKLAHIALKICDIVNADECLHAVVASRFDEHANITANIVGAHHLEALIGKEGHVTVDSASIFAWASADHVIADAVARTTGGSLVTLTALVALTSFSILPEASCLDILIVGRCGSGRAGWLWNRSGLTGWRSGRGRGWRWRSCGDGRLDRN